jgi:hypothetical protein
VTARVGALLPGSRLCRESLVGVLDDPDPQPATRPASSRSGARVLTRRTAPI